MSPEPRTIVVTGGAGFVGSRLRGRAVPASSARASRGRSLPRPQGHLRRQLFSGTRGVEVAGVDYREAHTRDIAARQASRADVGCR